MSDVDTAHRRCPTCGYETDAAAYLGHGVAAPEAGDVSLCLHCGVVAFYTDDGFRLPDPEEAIALDADPGVRSARSAWHRAFGQGI